MDEFLFFLGLYRSDVALDETCLYRAVSEKLYNHQAYHQDVKEKCLEFMRRNRRIFDTDFNFISFDSYLADIETGEIWAGILEIRALSLMYNVEFTVIHAVGQPPKKVTEGSNKLLLVAFSNNRFDLVLHRDDIPALSFCQSLVYGELYRKVFNFGKDIKIAIDKMLHDKEYTKQRRLHHLSSSGTSMLWDTEFNEEQAVASNDDDSTQIIKKALSQGIPPFPYKIAKTIDPFIYRNVEFDVWNEKRKDEQIQQLIPPLSPGVKCIVLSGREGRHYTGYVQNLITKDKANVYIEELCHIREVDVDNLNIIPVVSANQGQCMNRNGSRKESSKFDDKKVKKRYPRRYLKELEGQNLQEQTPTTPVPLNEIRQRSVSHNYSNDSGHQSSGRRNTPRRHYSNAEQRCSTPEFETPRRNCRPRCYTFDNSQSREIMVYSPVDSNTVFPPFQNAINTNIPPNNVPNQQLVAQAVESGHGEMDIHVYPITFPPPMQVSPPILNDTSDFSLMGSQSTTPVDIPSLAQAHETKIPEAAYFLPYGSDQQYVAFPSTDVPIYQATASAPMVINNGPYQTYYNTPPQSGVLPSWVPSNGTQVAWPVASYLASYNVSSYQVPMTPPWTPPTYQPSYFSTPEVNQGFIIPSTTPINYPPPLPPQQASPYPGAPAGSAVLSSTQYLPYPEYMY